LLIKPSLNSGILIIMIKIKKQELVIFLTTVGIASFFRLYQLNTSIIFSATLGILTVIGLYLLVKELFEWRLASIAGYLMAISFWHVSFSRTLNAEIMVPFVLVYLFYFLWRGIKKSHLPDFFVAGLFTGIGFYTFLSFYVAPIVAIILFINYWQYLKNDFSHSKYEYAKTKFIKGFVLFALTAFVVALPVEFGFWQHQEKFFSAINVSISNIVRTLGMFNFSDFPLLPWPVGVFFIVGFLNEAIHWLKRKHGHLSTSHTFMFAWFFVMLLPGFLSDTAPDPILTIGVLPVIMIFTARGIWWFFNKLNSWYGMHDSQSKYETHAITVLIMITFLFSIGFMEYWRYFKF